MPSIHRPVLLLFCVALLGFGPPVISQPPTVNEAQEPQAELGQLKAKVVELEKQLAVQKNVLEMVQKDYEDRTMRPVRRVLELDQKLNALEQSRIADASDQQPKRPSYWIPRIFNGQEYYIVPCKDDKKK